MNRNVRRAIKKYDKSITSLVRRITIKRLKKREIDFVIHGDRIVSTHQKEVEQIFNGTMLEVISNISKANGDFNLVKQLYYK